MAEEILRVIVSEEGGQSWTPGAGSGGVGSAGSGGVKSSATTKDTQHNKFMQRLGRDQSKMAAETGSIVKRFLPVLGGAAGIMALVKSSQIIQSTGSAFFRIFGAITDLLFMPLVPFMSTAMEHLVTYIPKIQNLAESMAKFVEKPLSIIFGEDD